MSLDDVDDESDRLPRWLGFTVALLLSLLIWLGVIGVFVGCSTTQPLPPGQLAGRQVTIEQALQVPVLPRLVALATDAAPVAGNQRHMPLSSACHPRPPVPLPYILPPRYPPRAGVEWRCRFVTSAMGPEPDKHLWLIISTTKPGPGLPAELSPIGMPGCQLAVNPQMVVHVPPGFPSDPSLPLSREPGLGRVLLRWTPPAGAGGFMVWLQVLVALPNSPAGFLLSYPLELTVGS